MTNDMTGKVSNYVIAQATGLWATDVGTIAERIGADEYAILNGQTVVECYTLVDAIKIADYVEANPNVAKGEMHAPAIQATSSDFERAIKLMGLRMG